MLQRGRGADSETMTRMGKYIEHLLWYTYMYERQQSLPNTAGGGWAGLG